MVQLVQLPDGREVEFPDGMPVLVMQRQIRDALAAEKGQRPPSAGPTWGEVGRAVDSTVRQVARGATLGFADEIAAGARTGAGMWGDYGAALAEERKRDKDFEAANPATATAAQMVGAVASPVARLLAPGQAGTMAGAVGRGAVAGAAGGGVAGFGEGEGGLGERLGTAARGAAVGGLFGGAFPLMSAGLAAGGNWLGQRVGAIPPDTSARRLLLRDLSRDGVSPEELVARAGATGKPEMIADLAGENVRQAAQAVARTPGAGQQVAAENLRGRVGAAQGERLAEDVRQFVSGDDFRSSLDEVIKRQRTTATTNYASAYATELPATPRLQQFLSDPDVMDGVRRGIASARREALADDVPFSAAGLGVRVGDDGSVQLLGSGMPTRLFDAAKRGLDNMIEAAQSGGERGRARELMRLKNALLAEVDDLNPAYAQARAAFAGDAALQKAAQNGRQLLTMKPEDFELAASDIAKLSPSEKEFFRLGVARGLMDRIGSTVDGAEQTRLNRVLMTQAIRERLRAAFDTDEEFRAFSGQIMREANMTETNRAIAPRGGSPTTPMAQKVEDMRDVPPGPASQAFIDPARAPAESVVRPAIASGGGLSNIAFRTALRVPDALRENAARRNSEALAPMLFSTDREARMRYAQGLLEQAMREARQSQQYAPLLRGALQGGAAASGLLAN